ISSSDALRCTLSEGDGLIARGGAGDDEQATRNEDDDQQPAAPAPMHRRRIGGRVYAIRR
ncbi:uncharacterized protein SCHCODRAFT_02482047, partial [Schizophyllum commune H4-8]|uniref:uncharacterized protein n=1 Tax=Schizophyllum commune (strain H4-8 / FGSC 9210) TaxID=578458 RepID=UPI0021603710